MKVKKLNAHIEHIISGYKHEAERYRQLLGLAQRLSVQLKEMKTGDDTAEFLLTISGREEIIENIKEIETNVSFHKEAVMGLLHLKEFNLDKVRDLIYPKLAAELNEQQSEVGRLIKEITEVDQKCAEMLNSQIKNVATELRAIQQHFEIQQVYLDRPERFPEPRILDEKK